MARAIARRAERRFRKVAQYYGADNKAMQYLNRLSDYLYVAAPVQRLPECILPGRSDPAGSHSECDERNESRTVNS